MMVFPTRYIVEKIISHIVDPDVSPQRKGGIEPMYPISRRRYSLSVQLGNREIRSQMGGI